MTYLLTDLGHNISKPIIFNANSGEVAISSQANLNANTKHIEIRYQYVRVMVVQKSVEGKKVGTNEMVTDVLTKPKGIKNIQDVFRQLHFKNPGEVSRSKGDER
ncbi:hypothetical protein O181_046728 [Austropuccinia psidii MF-1]|uniref:Uncharacterized protein n=1 Tax=Austropuccinia psidii MF-1 TaxID=1389203 RepID=A0A9Q3DUP1_9BASI|nr:hypothetical protein [Austropuccinia psidii MF-1]